jgi:hypothetical protein
LQHTQDTGADLEIDANGNAYVTGTSFFDPNAYHKDVVTVKYSSVGTKLWQFTSLVAHTIASTSLKMPHTTLDASGNIYLTTSYQENDSYTSLFKISSAGALVWKTDYITSVSIPTKGNDIHLSGDGAVYITGMIDQGNGNYLTLRYIPSSAARLADEEKEEVSALVAHPMPFKDKLTISFSLPDTAPVELTSVSRRHEPRGTPPLPGA